jgi:hypothetical protein
MGYADHDTDETIEKARKALSVTDKKDEENKI